MHTFELKPLADLCAAVYGPLGLIDARVQFPDLIDQRLYETPRHHVRFLWIETPDRYIVCFRGSVTRNAYGATARSWHLNFQTSLRPIPFGPAARQHAGYLRESARALRRIKGRLAGKPVTLTGHSQGGALALSLALWLHRRGARRDLEVVTFGQPRIGDRGLCHHLDRHRFWPVDRAVNLGDGVTGVPFRCMGYADCDLAACIDAGGALVAAAPQRPWPRRTLRAHAVREYARRAALVPPPPVPRVP